MKSMDLYKLIPNNDSNWIIKNNMIYYHHYLEIPLLKLIDGRVWIILDRRSTKMVLKLMKHLSDIKIPFYLNSKKLNNNQDVECPESISEIIRNYLSAIEDDTFFYGLDKINFDYSRNITNYILEYNCMNIFKYEYEYCKIHFCKIYKDWYTNREYYNVEDVNKRDYILGLEREIKLNIFI